MKLFDSSGSGSCILFGTEGVGRQRAPLIKAKRKAPVAAGGNRDGMERRQIVEPGVFFPLARARLDSTIGLDSQLEPDTAYGQIG